MPPRYDAIIFDLFGTLVDNITDTFYHATLRQTAELFGIAGDAFVACWTDEEFRRQRRCGILPSTTAQLEYVCTRFGIPVCPDTVAKAVAKQREEYGVQSLVPRPGTIATLMHLKASGYAVGLISDCSWEVPDVWQQTAFAPCFDATIFSCQEGIKKPHIQLYQRACSQLQVTPQRCLYIGDGDGKELTGARQAGMNAILICMPHERKIILQREDPRQWDGPVISSIEQVLDYLQDTPERGLAV